MGKNNVDCYLVQRRDKSLDIECKAKLDDRVGLLCVANWEDISDNVIFERNKTEYYMLDGRSGTMENEEYQKFDGEDALFEAISSFGYNRKGGGKSFLMLVANQMIDFLANNKMQAMIDFYKYNKRLPVTKSDFQKFGNPYKMEKADILYHEWREDRWFNPDDRIWESVSVYLSDEFRCTIVNPKS